jgi:hypothetical protein
VIGFALGAALVAGARPTAAQSLAQRVGAAGTGTVALHYAARRGACGDGRRSFSFGERFHIGEWRGDGMARCEPGPARVRLRVERGTVRDMQVTVGPDVPGEPGTTDLGAVASADAARFFLALADTAGSRVGQHAITAAVLADSVTVWRPLLAIAADSGHRARETRHQALFWAGRFVVAKLAGVGDDLAAIPDDRDDGNDARDAAVFALSQLRDRQGIDALLQVARTHRDPAVRQHAIFWLGESGDPRAIALFEQILHG